MLPYYSIFHHQGRPGHYVFILDLSASLWEAGEYRILLGMTFDSIQ